MIRKLPSVLRQVQEEVEADDDLDLDDELDVDTVDWEPLRRFLPAADLGDFMFMCIHKGIRNYKHVLTREYVFLDADARPYRYDGYGDYKRTTKAWAIKHVFQRLEGMGYRRTPNGLVETRAEPSERARRAGWAVITGGVAADEPRDRGA